MLFFKRCDTTYVNIFAYKSPFSERPWGSKMARVFFMQFCLLKYIYNAKIVLEICPRSLLESGVLCYLILQKKSKIAEGFALK